MKLHIYQLAFIAFTAFTVSSCKDTDINDEHHYDNKLYISSVPVTEDLLIKEDVLFDSRKITYRLAAPVDNEIQVSFDAKPSLAATYNLSYGDNATALPEAFYDIPVKNVTIQPGGISGDDIIVNFVNWTTQDVMCCLLQSQMYLELDFLRVPVLLILSSKALLLLML